MKIFIVMGIFLIFSSFAVAAQECIMLEEDMHVFEDVILCEGSYSIETGITVENDDIVFDCNDASLVGKGLGYGILLRGREGVLVRNCNITNYEVGIYLEESARNEIRRNYLANNRFGIVLFDADPNSIGDNILEDNSRSDTIEISPVKLFVTDEEATAEEGGAEQKTPQEVFEQAIRIKNPSLDDAAISSSIESIFNRYFNETNENLEIRRLYFFNKTDNTTKVVVRLIPKKPLENISVYEFIPKCMSKVVEEVAFEQDNYEVLEADPLIVWHFDSLEQEALISYTVFKRIDNACKDLLVAFGLATGFITHEAEKETEPANIFLAVAVTLVIVVAIVLFKVIKK